MPYNNDNILPVINMGVKICSRRVFAPVHQLCISDCWKTPLGLLHPSDNNFRIETFRIFMLSGFYRATACSATHGITVVILFVRPSVRPSVRLSVRRVHCDKTKWCNADILIPHETVITLLFWHLHWLVGDAPFRLKFALKVTHPLQNAPTSTDFRL